MMTWLAWNQCKIQRPCPGAFLWPFSYLFVLPTFCYLFKPFCQVPVNLKQLFLSHRSPANNGSAYLVCKLETTAQGGSNTSRCKKLTLFQRVGKMEGYSNSYQNGTSARETEFQRLAQNVGTNVQKILQNGQLRITLVFQFVPCLILFAVSSMQRMITQIGTAQDNQQLQNQLWEQEYHLLHHDHHHQHHIWRNNQHHICHQWWLIIPKVVQRYFYFLYGRHQIQHYTGQLAKDTSTQLKELNSYPPEQALDPR